MAACFEESNIFCFVGKGSCKWKIGLNFETNLPSEFGNLSICLLDSRCSVLGRFLVEENQSSDKKEKLHWAKLWTPIKWICMFICINLSLTYPSWRLGCQFGLRKSEKGSLNIHVPQQVKNENMSRPAETWCENENLFDNEATTKTHANMSPTCHGSDMMTFSYCSRHGLFPECHSGNWGRGTCSKHLFLCKFSYVYIWKKSIFFWYALPLPFYIPFYLKTPIWFENTILPENGLTIANSSANSREKIGGCAVDAVATW